MVRRLLMALGFRPAYVRDYALSPHPSGEGYALTAIIRIRCWATEEDVAVCRTKFLLGLRRRIKEEFGGEWKIRNVG